MRAFKIAPRQIGYRNLIRFELRHRSELGGNGETGVVRIVISYFSDLAQSATRASRELRFLANRYCITSLCIRILYLYS